MTSLTVDAHQHFWNLDRVDYPWLRASGGPLNRTIEAPELLPHLQEAGIDRTVLVQAANSDADTDYMLEQADRHPWIGGVVGWVPLDDPERAGRRLERLVREPKFRGVRHLIHDEPDPEWVLRDAVVEGLKVVASFGVPFDVVAVFPNHLSCVPTLAEKVPNLMMVIDHLGKPPIREKLMEPWAGQLAAAAACPRVYAKVSGLNTAADPARWSAEDLRPYVDWALERFGPSRLMYGSDWPVLTLAGDYGRVWRASLGVLDGLGEEDRAEVLGHTAQRFYRLDAPPGANANAGGVAS